MFKLFRRKYIYDLSIGKNFLSNPSSAPKKPLKTKKANEHFKIKIFYSTKNTKNKVKRHVTIWKRFTHTPMSPGQALPPTPLL